jgi:hypothetical protein
MPDGDALAQSRTPEPAHLLAAVAFALWQHVDLDRLEANLSGKVCAEYIHRNDLASVPDVVVHESDVGISPAGSEKLGVDKRQLGEVLVNHRQHAGIVDVAALIADAQCCVDLAQRNMILNDLCNVFPSRVLTDGRVMCLQII